MHILDPHFHWWPRSFFEDLCKQSGYPRVQDNGRGGYVYFREKRTDDRPLGVAGKVFRGGVGRADLVALALFIATSWARRKEHGMGNLVRVMAIAEHQLNSLETIWQTTRTTGHVAHF